MRIRMQWQSYKCSCVLILLSSYGMTFHSWGRIRKPHLVNSFWKLELDVERITSRLDVVHSHRARPFWPSCCVSPIVIHH